MPQLLIVLAAACLLAGCPQTNIAQPEPPISIH